jgi:hypothetical protein
MADRPDKRGQGVRVHSGDAAWKATKARIDARNDQARKAGREQRAATEERRLANVRAADRRERADIDGTGHRTAGT